MNEMLVSLEFDNSTLDASTWKITHSYASNGEYNITCRLKKTPLSLDLNKLLKSLNIVSIVRVWNLVSSQELGSNNTVEWYSAINNFVAIPRFIPAGLDANTHEGFPAFGPNNDLLPLDVNVTFFFDYDKGLSLISF